MSAKLFSIRLIPIPFYRDGSGELYMYIPTSYVVRKIQPEEWQNGSFRDVADELRYLTKCWLQAEVAEEVESVLCQIESLDEVVYVVGLVRCMEADVYTLGWYPTSIKRFLAEEMVTNYYQLPHSLLGTVTEWIRSCFSLDCSIAATTAHE